MIYKEKILTDKTTPYTLYGHGDEVFYHREKVIKKSLLGIFTWRKKITDTTHKNCKNKICI